MNEFTFPHLNVIANEKRLTQVTDFMETVSSGDL